MQITRNLERKRTHYPYILQSPKGTSIIKRGEGDTQAIIAAKNNQGISPIHDDPTSHHRQKAETEVILTRHHEQTCTEQPVGTVPGVGQEAKDEVGGQPENGLIYANQRHSCLSITIQTYNIQTYNKADLKQPKLI